MKILSIDTSSKICSVAVLDNKNVLKEENLNNGLTHSESLMPLIEQILIDTNLALKDINLIVCDLGPGSFTGIRIGVATTKAFRDSLNIPTVGVSSLEALAYNLKTDTIICSLIDAKNENVYLEVFEKEVNNYNSIYPATFSNIDEFLLNLSNKYKNITFVGDGALNYKNKILKYFPTSTISDCNDLSAVNLALAGLSKFKKSEFSNLEPLYLRKSSAELAKRKLFGLIILLIFSNHYALRKE